MAEKLGLEPVVNALHAIRLDCLLEGALAAFDNDLIAAYEERQAWWWIWKVARHRVELRMIDWSHTWCIMWSAIAEMMFTVSPFIESRMLTDSSCSLRTLRRDLIRKNDSSYDINGPSRYLRCGMGRRWKRA
jgi:hypothetical protein